MQIPEAIVLSVISICTMSFVSFFMWLIYKSNSRMSNFIMSLKSAADYQLTTNEKISEIAEEDIKRKQESADWEAYNEIQMRGEASEDDVRRFGIDKGVTS